MLNLSNLWWKLPGWVQKTLKPEGKTEISFTTHKGKNGTWFFHAPLLLTFWESLCFPEVLDKLSQGENKLKVHVSTNPTPDSDVYEFLSLDDEEPGGSFWKTPDNELIWLCGWLPWFFGEVPNKLYVRCG